MKVTVGTKISIKMGEDKYVKYTIIRVIRSKETHRITFVGQNDTEAVLEYWTMGEFYSLVASGKIKISKGG